MRCVKCKKYDKLQHWDHDVEFGDTIETYYCERCEFEFVVVSGLNGMEWYDFEEREKDPDNFEIHKMTEEDVEQ